MKNIIEHGSVCAIVALITVVNLSHEIDSLSKNLTHGIERDGNPSVFESSCDHFCFRNLLQNDFSENVILTNAFAAHLV